MLKKFIAGCALVLTAPIGLLLIQGEITLVDAGTRAGLLFAAVMVLRAIANMFPAAPVVVRPGAAADSEQ
jgi:hypothetical protein